MVAQKTDRQRDLKLLASLLKDNYITDGTMAIIIVLKKTTQYVTPEELKRLGSIKLFILLVLNGKMKVSAAPLPFLDMTQQVADWMAAGQ